MIIPHVITDARCDHVPHAIFVLDNQLARYDIDDVAFIAPMICFEAGTVDDKAQGDIAKVASSGCGILHPVEPDMRAFVRDSGFDPQADMARDGTDRNPAMQQSCGAIVFDHCRRG